MDGIEPSVQPILISRLTGDRCGQIRTAVVRVLPGNNMFLFGPTQNIVVKHDEAKRRVNRG